MVAHDEDALFCDMAETYHIFDMYSLPVKMVARLASGLRYDSRIKTEMAGYQYRLSDLLMAAVVDRLTAGHDGPGVLDMLLGVNSKVDSDAPVGFATGNDFEAARADLLRRINNDGN